MRLRLPAALFLSISVPFECGWRTAEPSWMAGSADLPGDIQRLRILGQLRCLCEREHSFKKWMQIKEKEERNSKKKKWRHERKMANKLDFVDLILELHPAWELHSFILPEVCVWINLLVFPKTSSTLPNIWDTQVSWDFDVCLQNRVSVSGSALALKWANCPENSVRSTFYCSIRTKMRLFFRLSTSCWIPKWRRMLK